MERKCRLIGSDTKIVLLFNTMNIAEIFPRPDPVSILDQRAIQGSNNKDKKNYTTTPCTRLLLGRPLLIGGRLLEFNY